MVVAAEGLTTLSRNQVNQLMIQYKVFIDQFGLERFYEMLIGFDWFIKASKDHGYKDVDLVPDDLQMCKLFAAYAAGWIEAIKSMRITFH